MDITLERILSLLPKKEDGSFVRGAKKDFATSIGYDSGDIVSMWIKGTSTSYYGKIHEIAAKYHVPVEYLTGETDSPEIKKEQPTVSGGLTNIDPELIEFLSTANDDDIQDVKDFLRMLKRRKSNAERGADLG